MKPAATVGCELEAKDMRRIGIVMDPIEGIAPKKDSTLAMMLAMQRRGWQIAMITLNDLKLRDGEPLASCCWLEVFDDVQRWFERKQTEQLPLADFDAILMRKDPPFDTEYIYATYLLEQAEARGTLVVNRPQSLRDFNEKLACAWFPQCTPPTLVTRNQQHLREFADEHDAIVLKPLDSMGGNSIFKLARNDANLSGLIELMTQNETRTVMAQRFIPEITAGDKRILLVDGEVIPYALARVPAEGEFRGNLAAGATGRGIELSERDRWLCQQIAPTLKDKGLIFVGIDVIGDYLTEINVTSPTGIRELDRLFDLDIAGQLMDAIDRKLD
jgi:glutathione synthase